jgi:starvation-inducible DNA-binding protein
MSCEKKLADLICDNFMLYFKAQTYHFNIVGSDFFQYHDKLGELYVYLNEAHDTLSEQLRMLDYPVPSSLSKFIDNSILDEPKDYDNWKDIFKDILSGLTSIEESGSILYKEAGKDNLAGLETVVGDYLAAISKWKWMVKSCLKN